MSIISRINIACVRAVISCITRHRQWRGEQAVGWWRAASSDNAGIVPSYLPMQPSHHSPSFPMADTASPSHLPLRTTFPLPSFILFFGDAGSHTWVHLHTPTCLRISPSTHVITTTTMLAYLPSCHMLAKATTTTFLTLPLSTVERGLQPHCRGSRVAALPKTCWPYQACCKHPLPAATLRVPSPATYCCIFMALPYYAFTNAVIP